MAVPTTLYGVEGCAETPKSWKSQWKFKDVVDRAGEIKKSFEGCQAIPCFAQKKLDSKQKIGLNYPPGLVPWWETVECSIVVGGERLPQLCLVLGVQWGTRNKVPAPLC